MPLRSKVEASSDEDAYQDWSDEDDSGSLQEESLPVSSDQRKSVLEQLCQAALHFSSVWGTITGSSHAEVIYAGG